MKGPWVGTEWFSGRVVGVVDGNRAIAVLTISFTFLKAGLIISLSIVSFYH
jgi:hypothetical protein